MNNFSKVMMFVAVSLCAQTTSPMRRDVAVAAGAAYGDPVPAYGVDAAAVAPAAGGAVIVPAAGALARVSNTGKLLLASIGLAAVNYASELPPVQTVLNYIPQEHRAVGTVLATIGTLGVLGVPGALYFTKWGAVMAVINGLMHTKPAVNFINHFPIIGNQLVTPQELDQYQKSNTASPEMNSKLTFLTMATFAGLQRLAVRERPDIIEQLGMMPN